MEKQHNLQTSLQVGSAIYSMDRLIYIYNVCEERWQHNLIDRVKITPIKYLLIAEAPPWSNNGEVNYFYNNFNGRWCESIYRAFYPSQKVPETETALHNLAGFGYLLVDSLPLALKYARLRNSKFYNESIKIFKEWWIGKLFNAHLNWAKQVKVALAFRVNGRKIIEALNGNLKLPNGQTVHLTEENIASDEANYTNTEKLRRIFDLTTDS